MNYDLLIIGAGPAGFSASIYASRYRIKNAIVSANIGGLLSTAHKVCNYPSETEILGSDLAEKMRVHAVELGAEIIMAKVTDINKTAEGFLIKTGDKELSAKSILLATGTLPRRLNIDGESRLLGKGISYCATCDGAFFRNKVVAVIGSGSSALTASLHLAEIANKVYQIVRGSELKGETTWIEQVKNNPKIEIIFNTNIVGLIGENKLEKIILDPEFNGQKELVIDGLFVEIGSTPESELFSNLGIEIDDSGYIKVAKDQATKASGVYAAGDITDGSNKLHQIITACAEGAIAAGSIFKYLKSK